MANALPICSYSFCSITSRKKHSEQLNEIANVPVNDFERPIGFTHDEINPIIGWQVSSKITQRRDALT